MLTAKAAYKSLHLTDIFNFSSVQLRESSVGQAIRGQRCHQNRYMMENPLWIKFPRRCLGREKRLRKSKVLIWGIIMRHSEFWKKENRNFKSMWRRIRERKETGKWFLHIKNADFILVSWKESFWVEMLMIFLDIMSTVGRARERKRSTSDQQNLK